LRRGKKKRKEKKRKEKKRKEKKRREEKTLNTRIQRNTRRVRVRVSLA
jgi:hypothetical protein